MVLISFITILIGNYLPTTKQNSLIGIRIPSTMKSENNWYRTHRFAGKIWVVTGFVTLIMTLLKVNIMYTIVIWILAVSVLPVIYSCVIDKTIK